MARQFTVAGGRFAPGRLGELTRVLPFELAGAVLEETLTVQRRLRDLPTRVGVYSCRDVPVSGGRLPAGAAGADRGAGRGRAADRVADAKALRRRIATMRNLFEVLAGPLARPTARGVQFGPFRTVSLPGTALSRSPRATGVRSGWDRRAEAATRWGADDPGGDRHPGHDRRSVRSHRGRWDRLRPPTAAPPAPRHAGLVGQGLRRQRLPGRGGRYRRPVPGPDPRQLPRPGPGLPRGRLRPVRPRYRPLSASSKRPSP
ncbi:transposase domain-containing protein [Streptomyces sp. NRRL F-2664]|uniref:transposase domain-containing protein n=1 Tax=Streptomyces sp. NRRL F-2664 TaxID=1463842 RepID=UPI00131BF822